MQLTWYGTAALILKEEDTSIAFDPFCGLGFHESLQAKGLSSDEQELTELKARDTEAQCLRCRHKRSVCESGHFDELEFAKIENVFITHGHFDHIAQVPAIYKDAPVKIRCTQTPYNTLLREGMRPEQIQVIRPGEQIHVGPFTVTAYQSRHCRFDLPVIAKTLFRPALFSHPAYLARLLKLFAKYPENKEILFYEVLCADKRIQIMGSLNLSADVEYPTGADMLILPFQGRSDLEKLGLSIVRRLKPKEVLLDHYDDSFPPVSDEIDTKKFEKILRGQEKIPCQALEKREIVYG